MDREAVILSLFFPVRFLKTPAVKVGVFLYVFVSNSLKFSSNEFPISLQSQTWSCSG